MDKKTKTLNLIFWSTVVLSLIITFYKTVIKQDFVIINYEESSVHNDEDQNLEESLVDEEI
jgi:hypothetical protein